MRPPVLIGFADSLAAIESAWCLSDEGFEVHAFAREGGRPALARSKAVRVVSITPPEKDAYQSAADLAAVAQDIGAAVVLPLDDHAVWLCDYAFGERASAIENNATSPVIVAGPLGRSALLALDKREQLLRAAAAGFAVPASRDAASEQPPEEGPWMIKPALAVELRDGKLRRPAGRMAATYEQIQDVVAAIGGPAIVQPLLTGTGEGVFGLATADGVVALSAHRRIRMMNPRGSGSSACRSIPVAEDLIRPVQDFIAASGLRGLFMVELLRDNKGQPWFMELNGRAWGSMALACDRGLAYPAWAVQSALDTGFVPTEPADMAHITARHLGREIVHLGAVLTHGGAPRLSTALEVLTLRRDERWYNWRAGQVSVFAADSWATVRNQLRRGRSA
jgi:biotin carboxylase